MSGLIVDGDVDTVRRLQRDPPAQWEKTVWFAFEEDGKKILQEAAIIRCPDCGSKAGAWSRGKIACQDCDLVKRMVG